MLCMVESFTNWSISDNIADFIMESLCITQSWSTIVWNGTQQWSLWTKIGFPRHLRNKTFHSSSWQHIDQNISNSVRPNERFSQNSASDYINPIYKIGDIFSYEIFFNFRLFTQNINLRFHLLGSCGRCLLNKWYPETFDA
jgi:hypothetical protein